MANTIEVDLDLDTLSAKDKLDKFETNAGKTAKKAGDKAGKNFGKGFSKSIGGLKDSLSSLKGLGTVAFFGSVTLAIKKGIDAAIVQEDAINKLNTALKISGKFSAAASVDLQNYASSLQETTKFGDETILETQALLQSLGGLSRDGLKQATKASVDLAAALGIDLRSAATLVGKAAVGEIGSFSRYGVVIKKGADNAETFSNALTELNKKFGGAAAAQVNTYSGATAQLSNAFGDLLEGIGDLVIKNPALISLIKSTTGFILGQATAMKTLANEFSNLFRGESTNQLDVVNKKMSAIRKELNQFIDRERDLKKEGMFESIFGADRINRLEKVQGRIKGLRGAIAELRKERAKVLADRKADVEEGAGGDDQEVVKAKSSFEQLKAIGIQTNEMIIGNAFTRFETLDGLREQQLISEESYHAARLQIATQTEAQLATLAQQEDKRLLASQFRIQDLGSSFVAFSKTVKVTNAEVAKSMFNVLSKGIGTAFKSAGKALAEGANAQQAFADAAKAAVADAASALGDFYITDGVARIAQSYGADATGYKMLAAGSALKLLSGVLGGGGGSGGSVGSGGGGAPGSVDQPGVADDLSAEPDALEERRTSTEVNINVQGSLVQQEELGLFIQDTLNEVNEKNGVIQVNTRSA